MVFCEKPMRNFLKLTIFCCLLFTFPATAQYRLTINQGHSHNDYHQVNPLLNAYQVGMGSIEADVFLRNGELYVAHDSTEIITGATLKKLYLAPLADLHEKNGNRPYLDSTWKLQLVVDIKENHQQVLPLLIKELERYKNTFNSTNNANAIRIVISGSMPLPSAFKNYPAYISFDGRPFIKYNKNQLKRIAMISDDLKNYTKWEGIGLPVKADLLKLNAVVKQAHQQQKPFRFWATHDNPDTWKLLGKLGVDWINTDQPEKLREFFFSCSIDSTPSPSIKKQISPSSTKTDSQTSAYGLKMSSRMLTTKTATRSIGKLSRQETRVWEPTTISNPPIM